MTDEVKELAPLGRIMVRLGARPQVFLSDEGKVRVDTLRRARRRGQITDEQLKAGLSELGMPESYIQAILENERVRGSP